MFALFPILFSYGQQANLRCIETTKDLIIYYPQYSDIDLVCEKMPEKTDNNLLFCCEAAFTGELLKEFKHSNIAGHHVSGGIFYKGYRCKPNTGCFVFYQGQWKFLLHNYIDELKMAVEKGGMGFGQNMIIYNGETQPSFRKLGSRFEYRAVSEYQGKLCIIDCPIENLKALVSAQDVFICSSDENNKIELLALDELKEVQKLFVANAKLKSMKKLKKASKVALYNCEVKSIKASVCKDVEIQTQISDEQLSERFDSFTDWYNSDIFQKSMDLLGNIVNKIKG